MLLNDFIKLEYNVFSKLGRVAIQDTINSGLAKGLRDYAESHNYEITENDLLKIISNKV